MKVLSDINFKISAGDYVGIVGPNGSGKSTLVRTVLGLMGFDSGSVTFFDSPLGSFSQWERIGICRRESNFLIPTFPVR